MSAFRAELNRPRRLPPTLGLWALVAALAAVSPPALGQDNAVEPVPLVPRGTLEPPGPEPAPATQGVPVAIPKAHIQGIEVNPLDEIAPDSIGTLGPDKGGFGTDMWHGTDRRIVERLLHRLPQDMRSPAMRDLARRLLLSIASPPAESSLLESSERSSLLALRIERLARLGEIPALNGLLTAVPSRQNDEPMDRARVDGLLLAHEFDEACRVVRNGLTSYHESAYWQKALIFCQLAAGEVDKGMLGLDLLREQGATDDPVFFGLASTFVGAEFEPTPDAELSPLHFALFELSGRPLPPGSIAHATPGLLFAIATAESMGLDQRARAAEAGCARGQLDGAVLAQIYNAFSFSEEQLGDPLSVVDSLDGTRARALLYQAARKETLPATRAEILRFALERAEHDGTYLAIVPTLSPLLSEVEAQPELSWFATAAGRALYAAGRYEQASTWLMLGRQEAILNPQASSAVAALWPYSRLAGGASLTTEGTLTAWRAMREGTGNEVPGTTQSLLRAFFQALGERDPLPWSLIAADGEPMEAPLPNAALLYALEEASEARRVGETVLLSLIVLDEGGPAEAHTLALGAVLTALNRIGLEQEARALAIEAALAHGV